MLVEYQEYQNTYPDHLVFYQVGDFYELFYEKAQLVSKELNLTLTSRDKNAEDPVLMCGVPRHSIDNYLKRLLDLGYSAVVISQQERFEGGKRIIDRYLERVLTPGMRFLLANNEDEGTHGVVAIKVPAKVEGDYFIAATDIVSGVMVLKGPLAEEEVQRELKGMKELDIVLSGDDELDNRHALIRFLKQWGFNCKIRKSSYLTVFYNEINGFGELDTNQTAAASILINYLAETHLSIEKLISRVNVSRNTSRLMIDAATLANLLLIGRGSFNLCSFIAKESLTVVGKKYLRRLISRPFYDARQKLALTEYFVTTYSGEGDSFLGSVPGDFENIILRFKLGIWRPADIVALAKIVPHIPEFLDWLSKSGLGSKEGTDLDDLAPLVDILRWVNVEFQGGGRYPLDGIICDGVDQRLDEARHRTTGGDEQLQALQDKLRRELSIPSLKIKSNNQLGLFIEVTKANLGKVPETLKLRQTTANLGRFSSLETEVLQEQLREEANICEELEQELFARLCASIRNGLRSLLSLVGITAELDCYRALGVVAKRDAWTKPEQVDGGTEIHDFYLPLLENPVVNSITFQDKKVTLLTGPNMGGKSTLIRSVAWIFVLAQIGSYVPCRLMRYAPIKQIFARVGAHDDLQHGESTFMVEMKEAAMILNNISSDTLILVDELGRGTSTKEGLAIAKAVLLYILKVGAPTIFATHFHDLALILDDNLINRSLGARIVDGEMHFDFKLKQGAELSSYGIPVARLAGIPEEVIEMAEEFLDCSA